MNFKLVMLGLAICVICSPAPGSADESTKFDWSGQSSTGTKLRVPGSGVSIIAFVRSDQSQSRVALEQIKGAPGSNGTQVIVVISGEQAKGVKAVSGADANWPIVIDSEFAASGYFKVHVWPTTIVVRQDGEQVAHLAGMSQSFSADLEDYLEFASGKIDAATLKARLAEHTIVSDDNRQKADRRLIMAAQLMERGELDQAKDHIVQGLALFPNDSKLSAMLVRLLLRQKQPEEALRVLQKLPASSMPEWQFNLLRARALVDLERWDDARAAAPQAIKLNPEPAEAHYLCGLIQQHDGNWKNAAEEFRKAYESVAQRR